MNDQAVIAVGRPTIPPGVKTEVKDDDLSTVINWDSTDADGNRRFPDKPEREVEFEIAPALALLLLNDEVFLNSHWYQNDWPEEAKRATALLVNCSDVFAWGTADAERIALAEVEALYGMWQKDPAWGAAIWCMIKRKELPQRPVADAIQRDGVWDLAALQLEHGLRANHYDGVSGVMARHKYAAYCKWARSTDRTPRPFDADWWAGWREYREAIPGWKTPEWEAEDDRQIASWRKVHGFHDEEDGCATAASPAIGAAS